MSLSFYKLFTLLTLLVRAPERTRDQRGVSQSTEQAILLACAAAVALAIVAVVTALVHSKLSSIPT